MNITIPRVVKITKKEQNEKSLKDGTMYSYCSIVIEDEQGQILTIDLFSNNPIFPKGL